MTKSAGNLKNHKQKIKKKSILDKVMENYQWTFTGCLGSAKFTSVVFVKTTGDSTTLGEDVL